MRLTLKRIAIAIGVIFLGIIGWIGWSLLPGRFENRMPNPNGYDDLVAAGSQIKGEAPTASKASSSAIDSETVQVRGERPTANNVDYSTIDSESLHAFVDPNVEVLDRARLGLSRECRVRLPDLYMHPAYFENAKSVRALGRLLAARSALDEQSGNVSKAAADAYDIIRLGRAAGEGGLMLERNVDTAIQSLGMSVLSRLVPKLQPDDARRLAADLMKLDKEHEPVEAVIKRERDYLMAKGDLRARAIVVVAPGFVNKMTQPAVDALAFGDRRVSTFRRLLALKLALRAYAVEHPDAPVPPRLDALVPGEVAAIPDDPFGKGPLRMHVEDGGKHAYAYSVGPDGKDDGGTPIPAQKLGAAGVTGDVTLDLP